MTLDWLLIGPWFSLNLSGAIMSGAIAAYLLRVRRSSAATRWLGLFFALYAAVLLGYEGPIVVYAPWAVFLDVLNTGLQPLMPVALIQFAYCYPDNRHRLESRVVLALTTALAVGLALYTVVAELRSPLIFSHNIHKLNVPGVDWLWWSRWLVFAPLWAPVVLARKRAWTMMVWALFSSLQPVLDFVIWTLVPAWNIQLPTIPDLVESLITLFTTILAFPIFALVYLNSTRDATSFMAKVVGVTLLAVVTMFHTVMNFGMIAPLQAGYDRERLAEVAHVEALVMHAHGDAPSAPPPGVAYVTARPIEDGTVSAAHRLVYARDAGFSLDAINAEEAWRRANGLASRDVSSITQRQRGYRGRSEPYDRHYVQYAFVRPEAVYEVGFSYRAMRESFHETTRVLAGLELLAVALVLVVVPLFFRANLARPLEALLAGVRRVNEGDLSVEVPVRRADEIGFLARSFNGMVSSVRNAKHLLEAHNAELEARNAQLERLTSLSRREREVAQLLAAGRSNREIAHELVITERTVAAHVEHIFDKLGMRSRTQVASMVVGLNGHAKAVLAAHAS